MAIVTRRPLILLSARVLFVYSIKGSAFAKNRRSASIFMWIIDCLYRLFLLYVIRNHQPVRARLREAACDARAVAYGVDVGLDLEVVA